VFILVTMSPENELTLSKIVKKIQIAELSKTPSRLAIYKRLHVLKKDEYIETLWGERGEKLYAISQKGISTITEFKNQLIRAELC